ncbi:MAG TPA: DUF4123 domain-containing protein [Burkholderiaceae bacterium]|jgi:hypothetical protein
MTRDLNTPISSRFYLLIDAAQYPGVWRILQYRFRRLPWLSLFEDTSDEEIVRSGPILIQVDANQTKTLAWFLDHTQDIYGLSWILSPLSLVDLRGHLSGLMQVQAADGSECAMRFFDTRILPVWYDVLNFEQKLHAFGPVITWSFLNRDGMECTLKGKGNPIAPASKTLNLSHAQEDALLNATLPDVVIRQLEQSAAAELAALPVYQRYGFITDQINKARTQYRIHSLPEIILFCTLALSIGENFDQLQSVAEILQNFAKASSESTNLGSIQPGEPLDHHNVPISLLVSKADSATVPDANPHTT